MYHWYPHGSKNLHNLIPYYPRGQLSWFTANTVPLAIYHDQEPLQFDHYTYQVLEKFYISNSNGQLTPGSPFLAQRVQAHLRGMQLYNAHDLAILCHSEKNSVELEKYQSKDFVGVYYWCHALIARDWFRFAQHDKTLTDCQPGPLFLVYNRSWSGSREYRLAFTEMIVNHGLANECLMTFNPTDQISYKDHQFNNAMLQIQRYDLEKHFDANTASAASSADYSGQDYIQIKIEVVLETLFDDTRHHLTEKTLRPIACGKPFLLAATPHSLKYLQDYGFETFSPWIDETYDTVTDPVQRLQMIVTEMRRINDLAPDKQQELFSAVQAIAQRNKALFFSTDWISGIVQEYQANFESAMIQVKKSSTGKYYKEMGKILAHTDSPLKSFYNKARPGIRTEQEMRLYLEMINVHHENTQ